MSTSSKQSLTSLLPTSYPIPNKLLSTTDLLVTLSLQRAPNLKPEEEIARTHACADLACQRLRVSLRLPNLRSSTAPCRPTVYKKLLTFLTEKLADVDVSGTPKRKRVEPRTPQSQSQSGQALSQSRSQSRQAQALKDDDVEEFSTPSKRQRTNEKAPSTPTPRRKPFLGKVLVSENQPNTGSELPFMLQPVRKLCKKFSVSDLVPFVYIGVGVLSSLIIGQRKAKPDKDLFELTVAVFLLTLTRMRRGAMTSELFDVVCQGAIEVLGGEETNVQKYIARINDERLTMHGEGANWWDDVPSDVLDVMDGDESEVEVEVEERSLQEKLAVQDPEGVLIPGLGTMMNDVVDLLGEEKIEDYERWKREIMREIELVG